MAGLVLAIVGLPILILQIGSSNRPALERFARHALESSPITKQRLTENRAAYSDVFDRLL